jgi:hypothetical protein
MDGETKKGESKMMNVTIDTLEENAAYRVNVTCDGETWAEYTDTYRAALNIKDEYTIGHIKDGGRMH